MKEKETETETGKSCGRRRSFSEATGERLERVAFR